MEELRLRQKTLEQQETMTKAAIEGKKLMDETKRKQRLADKLPAWTDNDHPDAYLTKFQATMSEAEIPQGE